MQIHLNNLNNFKGIERLHILSKSEIMRKYIKDEISISEACSILNIKASNFIKEMIQFKKSQKSIKSVC